MSRLPHTALPRACPELPHLLKQRQPSLPHFLTPSLSHPLTFSPPHSLTHPTTHPPATHNPPPAGVADAMVGMRVGETRSATLTLPTADSFQPASLRGQTAAINVTLKELFEYDLPEVS